LSSFVRASTKLSRSAVAAASTTKFQARSAHHISVPDNEYKRDGAGVTATAESRRAFTYVVAASMGVVAATSAKNLLNQFLDTWTASADVKAMAQLEVEIDGISEGTNVVLKWQGKPLFVRHRTPEEIDIAAKVSMSDLPDQQSDADRVKKPNWLVVLGVCTHLGCVPISHAGNFGGYFCPCHGSHYDTSGRIRQGPAPENLVVPPYKFTDDGLLIVG